MNQVVTIEQGTFDKNENRNTTTPGQTPKTTAEVTENTQCFISEALAEALIKLHERYGKPQSIDRLRREIAEHTYH